MRNLIMEMKHTRRHLRTHDCEDLKSHILSLFHWRDWEAWNVSLEWTVLEPWFRSWRFQIWSRSTNNCITCCDVRQENVASVRNVPF
jgi:hypothetical protein